MNIFWEKDHDTTLDVWLRQFRIEEVCMPNYTYVGGDITFRIGARFILHDGIDYWIGESATNRYGGYAYALLRVVDMPKLVNGGYRYWEFKTESWRETGYFYRFTVSSRQMDSKYP